MCRVLLVLLLGLWGISLDCVVHAQSHLFTFGPDQAGLESWPRPAGDVNGDGFDDIAIGSYWDPSKGAVNKIVQVYSGRDGRLIWELKARNGSLQGLVGLGDLDRDGYADIVAAIANAATKRLELWFLSGKTGKRFRTAYNKTVARLTVFPGHADVNADGYQDILAGDMGYGLFHSGRAMVFSGKDGSLIYDILTSPYINKYFGQQVAPAGDTNEDGYADFLVSALANPTGQVAYLYSGKTGKKMKTFGSSPWQVLGLSINGLGDINGDGKQDYAIGGATVNPIIQFMQIRSGAKKDNHKVLFTIRDYYPYWVGMAWRVAQIGDLNGDGNPDLALSAGTYRVQGKLVGSIELRSGKDGKFLGRIVGPGKNLAFGTDFWNGGDVNGDGRPDLVVQTDTLVRTYQLPGILEVLLYSGAPMDLWSDTHRVSLSKQGKQVLQLDAGPKHAGSGYFVLGSLSGIKPGLTLGGLTLPLQPDLYFLLAASSPNSAMFQGSLGVLDSLGRATCTITALKGLPAAWVGARADHAYILFKNGRFTKTSHWTPLLFEK